MIHPLSLLFITNPHSTLSNLIGLKYQQLYVLSGLNMLIQSNSRCKASAKSEWTLDAIRFSFILNDAVEFSTSFKGKSQVNLITVPIPAFCA